MSCVIRMTMFHYFPDGTRQTNVSDGLTKCSFLSLFHFLGLYHVFVSHNSYRPYATVPCAGSITDDRCSVFHGGRDDPLGGVESSALINKVWKGGRGWMGLTMPVDPAHLPARGAVCRLLYLQKRTAAGSRTEECCVSCSVLHHPAQPALLPSFHFFFSISLLFCLYNSFVCNKPHELSRPPFNTPVFKPSPCRKHCPRYYTTPCA